MDEVVGVAHRVPGWEHVGAQALTPLSGGMTNRNYVVDAPDGTACVLRVAGKDTEVLGINRAVEAAAQRQAAALGIAPEVLHVVMPEGFLVTRFEPGSEVADITEPVTMAQLTAALRSFHGSAPLSGRFDCFEVADTYATASIARGVQLPPQFPHAAAVAADIQTVFKAWQEPEVPCHHDLLNANLLRADDGRLLILDWEYAGMGSRWFDLGNMATNHELDAAAREQLIAGYFGSVTVGRLARLELMQVMSDLREAMWGVMQQAISRIEFDFVDYASRHFDRMLANASTPTFRQALGHATTP